MPKSAAGKASVVNIPAKHAHITATANLESEHEWCDCPLESRATCPLSMSGHEDADQEEPGWHRWEDCTSRDSCWLSNSGHGVDPELPPTRRPDSLRMIVCEQATNIQELSAVTEQLSRITARQADLISRLAVMIDSDQ